MIKKQLFTLFSLLVFMLQLNAADGGSSRGQLLVSSVLPYEVELKRLPITCIDNYGAVSQEQLDHVVISHNNKELVSFEADLLGQSKTLTHMLDDHFSKEPLDDALAKIIEKAIADFDEPQVKLFARALRANENQEKAIAFVEKLNVPNTMWLLDKANFYDIEHILKACVQRLAEMPGFKLKDLAHGDLSDLVENHLDQQLKDISEVTVRADKIRAFIKVIREAPFGNHMLALGLMLSGKFAHDSLCSSIKMGNFSSNVKTVIDVVRNVSYRDLLHDERKGQEFAGCFLIVAGSGMTVCSYIACSLDQIMKSLRFENQPTRMCLSHIKDQLKNLSFEQKQLLCKALKSWSAQKEYQLSDDELNLFATLPEEVRYHHDDYADIPVHACLRLLVTPPESKKDMIMRTALTWGVKSLFNQSYF